MKQNGTYSNTNRLRLLRTGDPHSGFQRYGPRDILDRHGPPRSLLSTSSKAAKSLSVGVLTRILYFTSGVFCPRATDGCLKACLGHTSGRMCLPSSTIARDQRTALYVEQQVTFLRRLQAELTLLEADALQIGAVPSARLNGTSDLPWERLHPELFTQFPDIRFFDYTKIDGRMLTFLGRKGDWPSNYHLTFSADGGNLETVERILDLGGTAAVVFWPEIPSKWRRFPVLDGDKHDARFLDPKGTVVGLRAKGLAQVDQSGFTVRVCPRCQIKRNSELQHIGSRRDSHQHTQHGCLHCGFELTARWKLAASAQGLAGNGNRPSGPTRTIGHTTLPKKTLPKRPVYRPRPCQRNVRNGRS